MEPIKILMTGASSFFSFDAVELVFACLSGPFFRFCKFFTELFLVFGMLSIFSYSFDGLIPQLTI